MNKIDIVKAVKNHQKLFTPENTGCSEERFQAIADAIVDTEKEGYITEVIAHESCNGLKDYSEVMVKGEITAVGEDLLVMEEAKGSFY